MMTSGLCKTIFGSKNMHVAYSKQEMNNRRCQGCRMGRSILRSRLWVMDIAV